MLFLRTLIIILPILKTKMLQEIELRLDVSIPKKYLDKNRVLRQSSVLTALMKHLLHTKSTRTKGYFIAITKLNSIGNGKLDDNNQDIEFPVSIQCRTFLPVKGEIMFGVVYKVCTPGILLRCGPTKTIYLPAIKMPNFQYVQWDNKGIFMRSDDLSKIQNDAVVRFVVLATRWTVSGVEGGREFWILASLQGDGLGPVSLAGTDELEL